MKEQESIDYERIAAAISYLNENAKHQPSLAEVADAVHLSPSHFQRLFVEWSGVSPKKFLQYLNIEHAKKLLKCEQATLLEATYEIGLSSTSRLHDLFISIEGMTPGEFKNGGEGLAINYSFASSPFGKLIAASTVKGICYVAFDNDEGRALINLTAHFPHAKFRLQTDKLQQNALRIFNQEWRSLDAIKLHLKGTQFQLKVWASLLKIPFGNLTTYGSIAEDLDNPKAARAVGTAIGNNPVAFLIPCHRVIQANGSFGGYMWGTTRKSAIIAWESSALCREKN